MKLKQIDLESEKELIEVLTESNLNKHLIIEIMIDRGTYLENVIEKHLKESNYKTFINYTYYKKSYYVSNEHSLIKKFLNIQKLKRTKETKYRLFMEFSKKLNKEINPYEKTKKKEKVLILSPHYDDELIGCGGMLFFHNQKVDKCEIAYFTDSSLSPCTGICPSELKLIRKKEAEKALSNLGEFTTYHFDEEDSVLSVTFEVVEKLKKILVSDTYDKIFLPNPKDYYNDHKVIYDIFKASVKDLDITCKVFLYEILHPLDNPNTYFEMGKDAIKAKKLALEQHKTQLEYMDYQKISETINNLRGAMISKSYCEMYEEVSLDKIIESCR